MASNYEETDEGKFRDFLLRFSQQYEGSRYLWLQCLLFDQLPLFQLKDCNIGMELFNELESNGIITYTDVELLSEIAELTNHRSAKKIVNAYKRDTEHYNASGEYSRLTPYRQAIFKASVKVHDDLTRLIDFYQLMSHEFSNIWDLVFYLEVEKLLDHTQEKIDKFSSQLNDVLKAKLLGSLPFTFTKDEIRRPAIVLPPKRTENVKDRFHNFLISFIREFGGNRYGWVRCLLVDHLTMITLSDTMHLKSVPDYQQLVENDFISSTDVELLSEIAQLTNNRRAIIIVNTYKRDTEHYNASEHSRLTPYRKAIFKTLMELTPHDFIRLSAYYQMENRGFHNSFDLVFNLELNGLLDDTVLQRFGRLLNTRAKDILLGSLESLSREIERPASIESRTEMANESRRFHDFLFDLSEQYVGTRCRWLRCLLFDHLTIDVLNDHAFSLFNNLTNRGYISSTDVDLLSEIAEITSLQSAIIIVNMYKSEHYIYNASVDHSSLTPYRKAIFEVLMNVRPHVLQRLIGYYKLEPYGFREVFDLVFYLEKIRILDSTPIQLKHFANLLNVKEKIILLGMYVFQRRNQKIYG